MRSRKPLEKDCNRKRREAIFEQHIFSKGKDGTNRFVINLKKTRPVYLIQPFQVRKSTFSKIFLEEGHFCVQVRPQGRIFLHYFIKGIKEINHILLARQSISIPLPLFRPGTSTLHFYQTFEGLNSIP